MIIQKHSKSDLEQMQSLPLDAKIRMSEYRIRQWYEVWDGLGMKEVIDWMNENGNLNIKY